MRGLPVVVVKKRATREGTCNNNGIPMVFSNFVSVLVVSCRDARGDAVVALKSDRVMLSPPQRFTHILSNYKRD